MLPSCQILSLKVLKIQDVFIIENGSLKDREIVFHIKVSKPVLFNSVTVFRVIKFFVAVCLNVECQQ